jgi:hypothetical protein
MVYEMNRRKSKWAKDQKNRKESKKSVYLVLSRDHDRQFTNKIKTKADPNEEIIADAIALIHVA